MSQFLRDVLKCPGASCVIGHWLSPPVLMARPGKSQGSQVPVGSLSTVLGIGSGQALTFMLRTAFISPARVTPSRPRFVNMRTTSQAAPMPDAYVASSGLHGWGVQYWLKTLLYIAITGSLAQRGSLTSLP